MTTALTWLGTALQVLGVILAATGSVKTWREFSSEGEGLLDPVTHRARRVWSLLVSRARRILRLKRSVRIHAGAGTISAGGTAYARGRKQFRKLAVGAPIRESLAELDDRTRELMDRVNNLRDRTEDRHHDIDAEVRRLGSSLDDAVKSLREQNERVARSGIRLEAAGLFLVALGLLAHGFALVL